MEFGSVINDSDEHFSIISKLFQTNLLDSSSYGLISFFILDNRILKTLITKMTLISNEIPPL